MIIPTLITVLQNQKERESQEEEDRLKREAIERKHRQENAYRYSCTTPTGYGSCSNNGKSFKSK